MFRGFSGYEPLTLVIEETKETDKIFRVPGGYGKEHNTYFKNKHEETFYFSNMSRKVYLFKDDLVSLVPSYREISEQKGVFIIVRKTSVMLKESDRESQTGKITTDEDIMDLRYRVVYFVPEEELDKLRNIFLAKSGVGLSFSPEREVYSEAEDKNMFSMDITIVNNLNPGKHYYVKLFNRIHTLVAVKNTRPDGAYVNLQMNNRCTRSLAPLTGLDTLGIYKTYDECGVDGDIESSVKLATLKTARTKLSVEEIKGAYDVKQAELAFAVFEGSSILSLKKKILEVFIQETKASTEIAKHDLYLKKARAELEGLERKQTMGSASLVESVVSLIRKVV